MWRYAISFIDQNDQELEIFAGDDPQNPGILSTEGIDVQKIHIPSQGQYRIDILVYGTGLDYNPKYAGIGSTIIEIGPSSTEPVASPGLDEPKIPSWIKNNAGWWADGTLDDDSFVTGIQFLIEEGIMQIPPTAQNSAGGTNEIPSWIKNNAGWWADGTLDDDSFVTGIQFLIEEGIMNVRS